MARRYLDRVVWSEGMLMCPQHLQQNDLHHEATLAARLAAVTPFTHGVVSQTVDEGELSSGTLKLSAFTGVLAAGLPLDYGQGDAGGPASRPVEDFFSSTSTTLEVFLAVPSAREGIPNFQDAIDDSANARYKTVNRPVPDMTLAKTEQIIGFGRANAVLLFGNESREDFETLKIAEIVRDPTGSFSLSTTYIPPCLYVSGSKVLVTYGQELLSLMLTKQRALSETRRQVDAAAVEFTSQDITRFLLLNALNTHIPVLRHVVESQHASPLELFLTMIQLAGELTTFSSEVDPSTFPKFSYNDLRSTFEPLVGSIKQMLGATVRERCITVPLESRPDGMWIGQLKDDRLLKCPRYVMAVEAQSPQQETANRLPKLSKIASWKQINAIVQSATPGAPLSATHRPPPEIPVRPKQVYFIVATDDRYWRSILQEKTIAVYLPPPFDPSKAKIKLMGIPDRNS